MKVLLIPDKFKGSLTAEQVCDAIEAGISQIDTSIEVIKRPMADGGEGSLDLLANRLNLQIIEIEVFDPLFRPIRAQYGISGNTAFVEMAQASGFLLLSDEERTGYSTSSWGTGQLIKSAIDSGAKTIFLFIGGSATNDGGVGMAAALGYEFEGANGKIVHPRGSDLTSIIDYNVGQFNYDHINFIVATDVKNLLLGKYGATMVYGSQKGSNTDELNELEKGLDKLANLMRKKTGKSLDQVPGSGAAGGMGAGAMAFLNASLRSGFDVMAELMGLDEMVSTVDLVISGEGKFDQQTLSGKLIEGISQLTRKYGKKLGVICGTADQTINWKERGIWQLLSLDQIESDTEKSMRNAFALVTRQTITLINEFGNETNGEVV